MMVYNVYSVVLLYVKFLNYAVDLYLAFLLLKQDATIFFFLSPLGVG